MADPAPVAEGTDPSIPAAGSTKAPSALRVIGRGFSWVTASQLLTAGGNLVLTPFVIHGLGVERYGLFLLTGTITSFLGSLNGGLSATANRYFPIYAGADDRVATTRLLVTFIFFLISLGSVVAVVDWFLSPLVVNALSMSRSLRPQSLFLFRTLGVLFSFGMAHQLVQSVVISRQRFDRAIQATLLCYCIWVAGLVWVVHYHDGLRGVAIVFVVQQVAAVAVIAPSALRYLTRKGLSLLPWSEVRQLFAFASKMQVSGYAGLINNQLDSLVVGTLLSVRTLAFYNSGNSFASQQASVASNVIAPASVHLGNTYGKEGPERAYQHFTRLQHNWVIGVTGWTAVGMGSAYFAVTAWLGPEFRLGGWVAIVVMAGGMFSLGAAMLGIYVTVMRKAGVEMRYGLVQMVVNLVVTLPLAFVGAVPVACGAALSQVVGAVYLVRAARRHIRPDLPNFILRMPVLRGLIAAAVTVVLELVVRPYTTIGAVGLLECVPPAAIGMGVFTVMVIGPRRAMGYVAAAVRQRGLPHVLPAGPRHLRDGGRGLI